MQVGGAQCSPVSTENNANEPTKDKENHLDALKYVQRVSKKGENSHHAPKWLMGDPLLEDVAENELWITPKLRMMMIIQAYWLWQGADAQ